MGRTDLAWDAALSAYRYSLYRDPVSALPGGFGSCHTAGIGGCEAVDPARPVAGAAFFYLVTAENRLLDEGPKGWESGGAPRGNPTPCP